MYVHGLVKVDDDNKHGWRAPLELGDAAPQYISFVVPLGANNELLDSYTCEIAIKSSTGWTHEVSTLAKAGSDSFVLELSQGERLWFHVRGVGKNERRLHYVGDLQHDDFKSPLVEIVPDHVSDLDNLYEEQGTIIIGCEPERHYSSVVTARHLG